MNNYIVFEISEISLLFSRINGSVVSAKRGGYDLVLPAEEPFYLQLLKENGDQVLLKGSDFASCRYSGNVFSYSDCAEYPGLCFEIKISVKDKFICFRNKVTGVPSDHAVEWVDAPQLHIHGDRSLLVPRNDGVVINDVTVRRKMPKAAYHPVGYAYRGRNPGAIFPINTMMQFMADYDENGGIFIAAFDRDCVYKALEHEVLEDDSARLSVQTFTGCRFGENYETPFDYVITGFSGNWMSAAQIYRDWYDSVAAPARKFPAWFEESPVILIYPVLGEGTDFGKHKLHPNCYYPYSAALPVVDKFNREFDSKVMALIMHWEGTAPWAPPYIWPPFGGESLLAEFRDALHKDGNLLGLYASGTAWTQTSSINDYSMEQVCKEQNLERHMKRGPHGEIDANNCNGLEAQRLGYDMCMNEAWPRQEVRSEVKKAAAFGVDYCQYFDQNLGGGQHPCYSREHNHAPVPGAEQPLAMRTLMEEIHNDIKSVGSKMVIGCECSAAEPYVDYLQLNDARNSCMWWQGEPVPVQSFVFHDRSTCFAGNQCATSWQIRYDECPENLLFRIAFSFNAGYLLSVTLKEEGKIHWSWGYEWVNSAPDQEQVITLVRNLNKVRKEYPQYLLYGRMEIPDSKIQCGSWILKLIWRDQVLPSVLDSCWSSADGSRARLLTNYLPYDQQVTFNGKQYTVPALSAVVVEL